MRVGRATIVLATAAALLSVGAGNVFASRQAFAPIGAFSALGGPDQSPVISLNAVDHGRALAAGTQVACSTGAVPVTRLAANAGVVLRIPHRVKITKRKTFSYSGPTTVFVLGGTGRTDVPGHLKLGGRFFVEKGSPFAAAVKGSFSSNVCLSATTRFDSA